MHLMLRCYFCVILYVLCVQEVVCLLECCVCLCEVDVCENGVCIVYIRWWLNVRGSSLRVCSELCPVCFHIFCECVSVLLYLVCVLIVVIMVV